MKAIYSKGDIILFILLLLVAAAGIVVLSGGGEGQTATIRQDGEIVMEVPLSVNKQYIVGDTVIEVRDGAVAFIESDCPDKVRIYAGWLRTSGATAACLPNRVSITVSGESGVDAIAN